MLKRRFACTIAALFYSFPSLANGPESSAINMTQGVTPISQDIYHLHMTIMGICALIGVAVFTILVYSLIKHRRSQGAVAATFYTNTKLEIIWTVIPFLILIAMAIPATKVLIAMKDTGKADLTIKVTGFQWKWRYDYLNQGVSFFSNLSTPWDQINNKDAKSKWYLLEVDNPVVVPTHKKIRFLITAADVIHSWWVPALGIKKDAVPGFVHDMWARIEKPGTYRGQCAELCGANHGFMPIVIKAVSPVEFKRWVMAEHAHKEFLRKRAITNKNKTFEKKELMQLGKKGYEKYCAACHKADGSGMPPAFPALKNAPIIKGPVNDHVSIVLNGVPGTAMQAFRSQLNDLDIAAIVTYERNAWGNDQSAGQLVQPATVADQRN